jgi:hypothetical protein
MAEILMRYLVPALAPVGGEDAAFIQGQVIHANGGAYVSA